MTAAPESPLGNDGRRRQNRLTMLRRPSSRLRAPLGGVAMWAALHASGGACRAEVPPPDDHGVVLEGFVTHRALEVMLFAEPTDDWEEAAYMTSPPDGADAPLATPAKFAWRAGLGETAALPPAPDALRLGGAPPAPPRALSPWSELLQLVGPERAALADPLVPLQGRAFFLIVKDVRGQDVYQVFTTTLEHTPSQATWSELAAAPQPLAACVVSAEFANDTIVNGRGPWNGPWIAFNITP